MALEIRVLGPLEVAAETGMVRLGGPKQRCLLLALLLERGRRVPTERLIDRVWSDRPPENAARSVQVYVSELRRLLGKAVRIESETGGYRFSLGTAQLDVERFERLLEQARRRRADDPARASDVLREALALWRGPALADVRDEFFAQPEADRLDELRMLALEERVEADLALGRHHGLVGELESAVAEHPYRERLRAQLMLALYRSGRQADALAAYRAARRLFVEELGIEPAAELRDLEIAILNQDAALTVEAEELRARRHLPASATALVGRKAEVDEVVDLVGSGGARLVTLTGPGGTGKTRLALQAAHELARVFADGVYFVDLAPVRDPWLVAPTIAAVLDSPGEDVAARLRGASVLLLLDNFEHVEEAAPHVSELLRAAAGLKVLVTSRAALRLYGEHEYPVPPLALDDAVQLFTQRAAAVSRAITAGARPGLIARVCERLDRLPLGIELAAARARELSLEQMLSTLPRLELTMAGPRDVPARHQTLRATIAWSEELLGDEDRRALAALAVFVGGWTLEAARTVADVSPEALDRLAAANLVRRQRSRFTMLETIREYALDRLDPDLEPGFRRRHAEHFLAVSETFDARAAERPHTADDYDAIEADLGNIRAAREHLAGEGRSNDVLALLANLRLFAYVRGHAAEIRRALDDHLTAARLLRPDTHAKALHAATILAYRTGDYGAAKHWSEELLALSRELGDPLQTARALGELGAVAAAQSDYVTARALYAETAELLRSLGDKSRLATALGNLGDIAMNEGAYDQAEELLGESVALAREAGDPDSESVALFTLAEARLADGRDEAAREVLLEALRTASVLGYREILAYCVMLAAELAAAVQPDLAARLAGAGESAFEELAIPMQGPEREAHERTIRRLVEVLGEDRFAEQVTAGRRLALEEAAQLARESLPDSRAAADEARRPSARA